MTGIDLSEAGEYIRDVEALMSFMLEDGLTPQEVSEAIAAEVLRRKAQGSVKVRPAGGRSRVAWHKIAPKCPECNASLNLREIALSPGRGNENAYRSQWYCTAGDCVYEEYSTLTASEQLRIHGLAGGERHIRRCNQER